MPPNFVQVELEKVARGKRQEGVGDGKEVKKVRQTAKQMGIKGNLIYNPFLWGNRCVESQIMNLIHEISRISRGVDFVGTQVPLRH